MKSINTTDLENRLQLLESYIPYSKSIDKNVSKVDVAWHIDHSLKVINAVVQSMKTSDPALYKDNFSFLGKLLLQFNYFPKGKAKAPKHVKPPEVILKEDIFTQLAEAKQYIKDISNLNENAFFKHPLFGNVNKKRVLSFLNAHTQHHLKIIKSILK